MKKIILFLLLAGSALAQNINNLSDAVKYYRVLNEREYLKNGADPNVLVDGDPAICYIARVRSSNTDPIFFDLLNAGANPNSIGKDGNCVLSISLSQWNAPEATELIKRGADVNFKNKGTLPPPLIIALAGHYNWPQANTYLDLIKLMVEKKADVNIQYSQSTTAIMTATQSNDFKMVEYFLDLNADPNIANSLSGETPLMIASGRGQIETMKLLFEHGADPNKIPGDKETALMRAAKNGYKDAVVLLLEKGAKTNFKNLYKENAQRLAELNGHKEIVDILKKASAKK